MDTTRLLWIARIGNHWEAVKICEWYSYTVTVRTYDGARMYDIPYCDLTCASLSRARENKMYMLQ